MRSLLAAVLLLGAFSGSLIGSPISNSGIGFAIPITPAKGVVGRLIRAGGAAPPE
ncbi:S1-C subfamily serine protease [Azospirillum agricola]|uniref:hypothetical protein n=1 Tax=Azospirillum agricola TaxID=1720247 RepID=UPI001AEB6C9E|nr:hypothetical protein [Azospirillum agricola]MBP2233248.1 S1-C subfamily serine protease [Azospirillum agricola]